VLSWPRFGADGMSPENGAVQHEPPAEAGGSQATGRFCTLGHESGAFHYKVGSATRACGPIAIVLEDASTLVWLTTLQRESEQITAGETQSVGSARRCRCRSCPEPLHSSRELLLGKPSIGIDSEPG
jgi:hypothetical protein